MIFLLTGLGATASGALAKVSPARVMLAGCLALTAGALVTFAAIETSTPWVLFLGTAIAGLGFGPGFLGAYRATATVPLVTPGQRAGLITAIYIVSYVATAVPAVIGGITTSLYGLHDTALVYSVAVGVLTATAAIILLARRTATPAAADAPPPAPSRHRAPAPCRNARRTHLRGQEHRRLHRGRSVTGRGLRRGSGIGPRRTARDQFRDPIRDDLSELLSHW